MDTLWKLTERLIERIAQAGAPILLALGMGLARAVHSWQLNKAHDVLAAFDPHLAIDAGQIPVFVALAVWAAQRGPLCKRSWPLVMGIGWLAFSLCAADPTQCGWPTDALNAAGYFGMGCAYALFLLVWLEAAGCLPPIQALLSLAGSYVVGPAVCLALNHLTGATVAAVVAFLGVACAVLVVQTYRIVPGALLPPVAPTQRTRHTVSPRIALWVALISLAYGLGDRFAPIDPSSPASKLGMVVPFAVIALGCMVFRERIDIRTPYHMSLVFMGAGVLSATLSVVPPDASQLLMSTAHTANLLVACVMACTSARRNRESAVFGCGVLLAISLACILAGNFAQASLVSAGLVLDTPAARATCAAVIVAVIALAAQLMRDVDLASLLTCAPEDSKTSAGKPHLPPIGPKAAAKPATSPTSSAFAQVKAALAAQDTAALAAACLPAASQAGLSKRETAVFQLMLCGDSAAVISEKLFIAPGTVRAHMSRIYDKLGVHSREEFGRLFCE